MSQFYKSFKEIKNYKFDGIIITGAPIEKLAYETVNYWRELCEIFDWAVTNAHSVFSVCWGAMAMLNFRFGINKYPLSRKAFGCYRHENLSPNSPYLRGISDEIIVPISRWTKIKVEEVKRNSELKILLNSTDMGPCLIEEQKSRNLYMLNHFEYETNSLNEEYQRDLNLFNSAPKPENYFPKEEPNLKPKNRWRSHAHLLFGNWINQIYQETPFDINSIRENTS